VEEPSLPCQKQKRKRYASGRGRRGQIPHQRPLSDRPLNIELRNQVGHWWCDTVMGANHKGAIVAMVVRKRGFSVIFKVSQKTSELVNRSIIEGLCAYIARVIKLTYDKGKEFAGHIQIDQALNSTSYSAGPFARSERGSSKSFNGLLRQCASKKKSLNTVNENEIKMIQNRLNNSPRKSHGHKKPAEVFNQSLKAHYASNLNLHCIKKSSVTVWDLLY